MAIERTFSILKPDATARNLTGAINAMIEKSGLRIIAQKRVMITRAQAEAFYAVHRQRPFFGELVDFMISGPVVVQVLEGENAITAYRDLMGATDPAKAAEGTIRKAFAKSISDNSVHGSDSSGNCAKRNRAVFFRQRNSRLTISSIDAARRQKSQRQQSQRCRCVKHANSLEPCLRRICRFFSRAIGFWPSGRGCLGDAIVSDFP